MAYENTGRLFKNKRKTKETHPDYRGDFTDGSGKKWDCAAWLRKTNGGGDVFLAFKVTEWRGKVEEVVRAEVQTVSAAPFDDEIPF